MHTVVCIYIYMPFSTFQIPQKHQRNLKLRTLQLTAWLLLGTNPMIMGAPSKDIGWKKGKLTVHTGHELIVISLMHWK